MLEKLILAAILTFTLSIFTELSVSSSSSTAREKTKQAQPVFTLSQRN